MKKILLSILGILALCGAFFLCARVATGPMHQEYGSLWEARRLRPELLPTEASIRLTSAGHDHTYADTLWINLIQYIGDNIGNGKYKDYIAPLVNIISEVHPQFSRPYTLTLLMAPNPLEESPTFEADMRRAEDAIQIGKRWMHTLCDAEKIQTIRETELGNTLWNNPELKNPCTDGLLPYYLASVMSNIGEKSEAEQLYKIATLQSDAPQASRFLSVLERAESGDMSSAATRFLLIGVEGYDEDGGCHQIAGNLLTRYRKRLPSTPENITEIRFLESRLTPPLDITNPLSQGPTNCYDSVRRGIKQLYLGYITEIAEKYPNALSGEDLIHSWAISEIPTPRGQEDFTVKKGKDGLWSYRKKIP